MFRRSGRRFADKIMRRTGVDNRRRLERPDRSGRIRSGLAVVAAAMARGFGLVPLLLVLACAPVLAQDDSQVRRGEALVTRHCAMCHAVGRTGSSPHAEAPAFRTLSQRYEIESLEEALGEGILSGHPDMPEFRFGARDVGAVIAYLKAIQER